MLHVQVEAVHHQRLQAHGIGDLYPNKVACPMVPYLPTRFTGGGSQVPSKSDGLVSLGQ